MQATSNSISHDHINNYRLTIDLMDNNYLFQYINTYCDNINIFFDNNNIQYCYQQDWIISENLIILIILLRQELYAKAMKFQLF